VARSSKRTTYLLLIAAFLVGASGSLLRIQALAHSPLRSANEISFIATVDTDPVLGQSKVVGSRIHAPSTTFRATLNHGVIDGHEYSLHLPVRISSARRVHFLPGSVISGTGKVFSTSERRVAALIAARPTLVQISATDPLNKVAGQIRDSFRREALRIGGASGALIPGLVLGDTSLESSSFITDMRRAGLTHLTAVSGENFAIIAAFLLWVLQFLVKRLSTRLVITAVVLITFIFLVRPSPSVLRASVMTSVLLIGRARGERSSALPALGLAIAFLILADPFQAIDPGFALSVSATAGILILAPVLTEFFARYIRHEKLVELMTIPIAATIFCTPLIIAISGQFSLVALPANFLVSEVVGPITIIGFVAALISPITPLVTHLLLLVCKPFAGWVVVIAHTLGSLPLIKLPKSFLGAAIALLILVLVTRRHWRILIGLLLVIVVAHLTSALSWPGKSWLIVNCNVGQGDGAVVNLGNGNAIVIDTGPDPALMDSCLKSLHISRIPLLVLTHYHADHVNGLSGVLDHRSIGQIWVTNNPQPTFEYQQTMDLLKGRAITIVHQGESLRFSAPVGSVAISVLWPRSEIEKLPSLPGDGSGINNSSIALLISIGKLTFYTSGDTEPPAQEEIAASGLVHTVDLMKVSHHGSAYQDLALFDLLHPKIALISVGAGNPYGHPAASTIAALEERGIKVYRTDRDGAISVSSDLKISTQKKRWWEISWG